MYGIPFFLCVCVWIGPFAENRNCIDIVQGMRLPLNINVKSKRQTVVSNSKHLFFMQASSSKVEGKERKNNPHTHARRKHTRQNRHIKRQQQKLKATSAFIDSGVFPLHASFLNDEKEKLCSNFLQTLINTDRNTYTVQWSCT